MTDQGKIIDRVRKLLKMANDNAAGAEHERNNALRMAHKLIAKHNLEQNDYGDTSTKEVHLLRIDVCPWRRIICSSMAELFFTKVFTVKVGKQTLEANFVGSLGNSITAKEMTRFMISSLSREAAKRRRELFGDAKGQASRWETSFLNGAATAIYHRCVELRAKADLEVDTPVQGDQAATASASTALALASKYASEAESNEKYILDVMKITLKKAKASYGSRANDVSGLIEGQAHGKRVPLNKQLG